MAWPTKQEKRKSHVQYLPSSSKYLVSRCLDPETPPEKAFGGSKHLLTRYLGDFGRLGLAIQEIDLFFPRKSLLGGEGVFNITLDGFR